MMLLVSLVIVSVAWHAVATEEAPKTDTEDKYGIFDKVKKIVSGASLSCNNKYITHPIIEKVFCEDTIPEEYAAKLGISFGADSTWCAALACAYRAMGCPDPTYRIEAKIIMATGKSEECLETVGLDKKHCQTLSKFIAKVPAFQNDDSDGKKREVEEESTPVAIQYMSEEERTEAKRVAANAMRALWPNEDFSELNALVPVEDVKSNDKRDLGAFIEELQVCSPLIAKGIKLVEGAIKLPVNASEYLGPCGNICNWAVCGLNVLCKSYAGPILDKINNDRKYSGVDPSKCPPLVCAQFVVAPKSVCEDIECPHPYGHFTEENCPAPKTVHIPLRTTVDDCCEKCEDTCAGVQCPVASCPEPEYPSCVPGKIAKYSVTDCCEQCVDPCYAQRPLCPPAPQSCPPGQFIGPARPGDCCLSCQPKCVGVSCSGAPTAADCASQGKQFQAPLDDPKRCGDCCGQCVTDVGFIKDSATNVVASVFAAAAAAAAAI